MDPYQEFERVIRSHSLLKEGNKFDADAPMTHLGIESAQIVGLILELEDTFTTEFPDAFFTPEVFATPNTLWTALKGQLEAF